LRKILIILLCFGGTYRAFPESFTPSELKVAIFLNIAKFVEWPATSVPAESEIIFGVVGDDTSARLLSRLTAGKKVGNREIQTLALPSKPGSQKVHALLLLSGDESVISAWLKSVDGKPVLTVGDGNRFLEKGGLISLTQEGDRIRFDVNQINLQKTGLAVSSQVLALARKVVQ
jgi:hypothetical protein